MGNGTGKISRCFAGAGEISRRHDIAVVLSDPLDEGLGHSFCYIRPDDDNDDDEEEDGDRNDDESSANNDGNDNNKAAKTTTFRAISGASVSANNSTPLSTSLAGDAWCPYSSGLDRAATFESSTLFSSIPLQPVPRYSFNGVPGSGPIERGFLSGPIERAFVSGPIYSGPTESDTSFSSSDYSEPKTKTTTKKKKKKSLMEIFKRAVFETVIFRGKKSIVAPIKSVVSVKESDSEKAIAAVDKNAAVASSESTTLSCSNGDEDEDGELLLKSQNLQWAQGKAGEDRVHVVISEEHGWVFVGIYDGFNGPDAPDYLLSNLYPAVHKELKGLLWSEKVENSEETSDLALDDCVDKDPEANSRGKRGAAKGRRVGRGAKAAARWKCEWNRERLELDKELKENFNRPMEVINHPDVLRALSQALRKTEDAYLDAADKMVKENPELALMGSCVLVMLMKGEDVYLMNVGDSRAVLARKAVADLGIGRRECRDLDPINEETMQELELSNGDDDGYESELSNLTSLQLTIDHSTYVEEEVQRIKNEHPDDACAVMNDRVKGYLKVTRAFGAGFLKQPKWNDALLEMFRIDYIGTCPYLTCMPSLHHHKLSSRDRFLILSSDGLYQYFTNEQAVSEVELFIASFPEGDPAQHLVEEVLFRAARKAGMDFHELLDIPQGERRRYHDDVSIIIISLEGRIWRSSV